MYLVERMLYHVVYVHLAADIEYMEVVQLAGRIITLCE